MFDRSYLPAADFEFVVIGDTHYILDPEIYASAGDSQDVSYTRVWSARAGHALQLAAALEPDFVVHLGDLDQEFPGKDDFERSRQEALAQISSCGLQPHHVAGNMDIGDKPNSTVPAPWVRPEDIHLWHAQFGCSWYSFDHAGVHCIVLNTQIMNGPLPEAAEQRAWFDEDIATHSGRSIFLFLHMPPFAVDEDEPGLGSYNSLDEPVREWLLGAVRAHNIELMCSGHTHTAAYHRIGQTRFWIVPSTTTSRPAFNEIFTVLPEHRGKNDVDKLGFYLARSQQDGVRMHLIRSAGETELLTGNGSKRLLTRVSHDLPHSPLGVNLRLPLAPTTLGVQAWPDVVRQRMRDDYPLLACIELGARHLRLPAGDLDHHVQRERLAIARDEGMQVTATWLWSERLDLTHEIARHAEIIDTAEVQMPGELWPSDSLWEAMSSCREQTGKPVSLTPLLAQEQVAGKYHPRTRVGYLPDELTALNDRLAHDGHNLDYAVCTLPAGEQPWEALQSFGALLPLSHIGAFDVIVQLPGLDDGEHEQLVAEALLASALLPNTRLILDPLVDVDRSSDINNGLLDRSSNPRTPFHVARCLNTILFSQIDAYEALPIEDLRGGRVLGLRSERVTHRLEMSTGAATAPGVDNWTDLAAGRTWQGQPPGIPINTPLLRTTRTSTTP